MLPTTSGGVSRRTFYTTFINLLGAVMAGVVAIPAAVYLLMKPKSAADRNLTEITDVGELQQGKPE